MFKFNPIPKENRDSLGLLKEGWYDFEVTKAEEKIYMSNNTGINLTLNVWDESGKKNTVFDKLMIIDGLDFLEKKFLHFCEVAGLMDDYDKGGIQDKQCEGVSGRCKINIRVDKKGNNPPSNNVADYAKKSSDATKSSGVTNQQPSDFVDDKDILF